MWLVFMVSIKTAMGSSPSPGEKINNSWGRDIEHKDAAILSSRGDLSSNGESKPCLADPSQTVTFFWCSLMFPTIHPFVMIFLIFLLKWKVWRLMDIIVLYHVWLSEGSSVSFRWNFWFRFWDVSSMSICGDSNSCDATIVQPQSGCPGRRKRHVCLATSPFKLDQKSSEHIWTHAFFTCLDLWLMCLTKPLRHHETARVSHLNTPVRLQKASRFPLQSPARMDTWWG